MLLVFGVSFMIPLFVILLNLAGVVSGKALGEHRAWIIVGVFVFAAAATPSTDPFSMLMLALPMTLLFFASEIVARSSTGAAPPSTNTTTTRPPRSRTTTTYVPSGLGEEDD